jgi:integrase
MSNRSPGQGSVSKRQDGRWQASLQIDGVRRTVYGRTEREVRSKLRDLQLEVDRDGGLSELKRRTVNDLLDAWLDNATNLKPSTISKYSWFLDTCVRPSIGKSRLNRITPTRLQDLYASLKPSIAEKVHRLLHRAFAVAVLWRWIPANPCDRVLKPTYKPRQKNLWNSSELNTFLDKTRDHWLHPLWVLLITTGCRIGETLALAWEDINIEGKTIYVSRTLHRIDGEWVLDTVKTNISVRTIALPDVTGDVLGLQKQQQAAWREAAGGSWEEWGLVFTGKTGMPLFASTVQNTLRHMCAQLDLPAVTPHGLRHLHASLLIAEGVPITAVSARLGHANPQITMKIYAHALPGQDQMAAQIINDALGKYNGPGQKKMRDTPETGENDNEM